MRPGWGEGEGVLSRGRRGVTERTDDLDLITAALIQLIFEATENSLSACGLARIVATVDGFFIRPDGGVQRRGEGGSNSDICLCLKSCCTPARDKPILQLASLSIDASLLNSLSTRFAYQFLISPSTNCALIAHAAPNCLASEERIE